MIRRANKVTNFYFSQKKCLKVLFLKTLKFTDVEMIVRISKSSCCLEIQNFLFTTLWKFLYSFQEVIKSFNVV